MRALCRLINTLFRRVSNTLLRAEAVADLSDECLTYPSEHARLSPGNRRSDVTGSRYGVHRRAEMTIADDLMQLPVGQFEEPLRFAVVVVFQPGDKYTEVAKIKVADAPTHAYPIASGNRIFVKDQDSLILWTVE